MSKASRNARYYAKKKELLAAAQARADQLSAENLALRGRLKSVGEALGAPVVAHSVATAPAASGNDQP